MPWRQAEVPGLCPGESLFVCLWRGGGRQAAGVRPLSPLGAAGGGLLCLSSSPGLLSTSQSASRLGRGMHGRGGVQGSAPMSEHPRLRGICLVEGGLGCTELMTPCGGSAPATLQNVVLCTNKVSQALRLLGSPAGRREDCADTARSPAGMLPPARPRRGRLAGKRGGRRGALKPGPTAAASPSPVGRAELPALGHRVRGERWSISLKSSSWLCITHPARAEKQQRFGVLLGKAAPWFPHGFSNLNPSKSLGLSILPGAKTSPPAILCLGDPVEGAGGPWPPAFVVLT